MLRRPSVLVLAILVALLVAPAALATLVHVQVEGKRGRTSAPPSRRRTGSNALQAPSSRPGCAGKLCSTSRRCRSARTSTRSAATAARRRAAGLQGERRLAESGPTRCSWPRRLRALVLRDCSGPRAGRDADRLKRAGKGCYSVVAQDDAGKPVGVARRPGASTAKTLPTAAARPASACTRDSCARPRRCDPVERPGVSRLALLAVLVLAGCGGGGDGHGRARLWVTRARGATVLLRRTVRRGNRDAGARPGRRASRRATAAATSSP